MLADFADRHFLAVISQHIKTARNSQYTVYITLHHMHSFAYDINTTESNDTVRCRMASCGTIRLRT